MPNNGYSSADHDREIEQSSGFFCQGCLVGKPLDDMSSDLRYCLSCYDFLLKEADILIERGITRHPDWIPQNPKETPRKEKIVAGDMSINMSTLERKTFEVDIIQPPVGKVTCKKRGPRYRDLPVKMIVQFSGEGMGSKAIAARLNAEYDIKVSYKTIQRIVGGQRVLVL